MAIECKKENKKKITEMQLVKKKWKDFTYCNFEIVQKIRDQIFTQP